MKRAQELRKLSSDHHRSLVIAKKAKTSYLESMITISGIWEELNEYYKTELENHLRQEELYIVPHLLATGELELVNRLNKEHKDIRAYFVPRSSRTPEDLVRFGELLEGHIRFEERELFSVIQESLNPEALASIEKACK